MSNPGGPLDSGDKSLRALLRDYQQATIDIISFRLPTDSKQHARLLFASMRLVPRGECILPEIPTNPRDGHTVLPGHVDAWHRRAHLNIEAGLKWFRNLGVGGASIPHVQIDRPSIVDNRLTVAVGGFEPPWGSFCVAGSTVGSPLSFAGSVPAGVRFASYSCTEPEVLRSALAIGAWGRLCEWVHSRCGLNLAGYPDLAGCVYLILPNPLLRELDVFFPEDQVMAVHLRARVGCALDELTIVAFEERFGEHSTVVVAPVRGELTLLRWNHDIGKNGMHLICSTRGTLYSQAPAYRLRQISVNIGIRSGTRQVSAPARKRTTEPETYEVPLVSSERTTSIGTSAPAHESFLRSRQLRWAQRGDMEERALQVSFLKQIPEATTWLRAQIATAQKRVRMVDPFLSEGDIARFALATGREGVKVQCLLTRSKIVPGAVEKPLGRLVNIESMLNQISQQDRSVQVEVRVLLADDIHDRFLVVDDQTWVLGCSFNNFGDALTTAARHDNNADLLSLLDAFWENSTPLHEAIDRTVGE